MTSLSLTRELIVPGSDRGTSPLTGVSTPAGTSTLKAEVGRRKRSLSRGAAQRGISTDAVARFRQPTAFQRRPRHSLHRPPWRDRSQAAQIECRAFARFGYVLLGCRSFLSLMSFGDTRAADRPRERREAVAAANQHPHHGSNEGDEEQDDARVPCGDVE